MSPRIARDYADRHPRNGSNRRKPVRSGARKPASRGSRGGKSGLPAWAWMVLGLSLGLVVAALAYIGRPAKPMDLAPSMAEKNPPKTIALPPKEPSRFAFYEMLPSYEVVVPDEELNRAAASKHAAKPPPAPVAATLPAPTAPPGTALAASPGPAPASGPQATPAERLAALQAAVATEERSRAAPAAAAAKPAGGEHYLIQVAAYRQRADAEQQRAALALVGLAARVEQVTIDNRQTWYRVRLGPYADTAAAQAAQRSLQAQGLNGVVMKIKS